MVNLVIEVSKYLMILLMLFYTYFNFRYFSCRSEMRKSQMCTMQNRMMFLIHFTAYMIIYLKTDDEKLIVLYLAQLVFFVGYIWGYRLLYHNVSRLLVNNLCMFLSAGFIILTRISFDRALRQFIMVLAAAVATLIIPFLIGHVWQFSRISWVYGGVGLFLLIIVFAAGQASFGALLSLNIGGFVFQPSELVKISFVFFIASMFYKSTDFRTILVTTSVAALHVLVLAASKDLGSALIFFLSYVFILFVATSKWIYLLGGLTGGVICAGIAYQIFSHVRIRVSAWLNPWVDIDNKGYQITQSLFAIGTGGWFGMGLYQGMPYKIPVVEKDFVYAAISEELGGIFALCLLLVYLGCFLQFMSIAGKMQALFYKLIAFGLGTVFIIQVLLAVGGVTKFIPSTGVTLPLISYGGSSVFSTFILFGVMQGLYILKRNEEEEDEKAKFQS